MGGLPGLFVTFEGVEGAGKTTQIALLRAALQRDGLSVCVTREPGGDALGESVRHLLLHTERFSSHLTAPRCTSGKYHRHLPCQYPLHSSSHPLQIDTI